MRSIVGMPFRLTIRELKPILDRLMRFCVVIAIAILFHRITVALFSNRLGDDPLVKATRRDVIVWLQQPLDYLVVVGVGGVCFCSAASILNLASRVTVGLWGAYLGFYIAWLIFPFELYQLVDNWAGSISITGHTGIDGYVIGALQLVVYLWLIPRAAALGISWAETSARRQSLSVILCARHIMRRR